MVGGDRRKRLTGGDSGVRGGDVGAAVSRWLSGLGGWRKLALKGAALPVMQAAWPGDVGGSPATSRNGGGWRSFAERAANSGD